ncbi:MAG: site-specific integrase [Loktanella sp.]|nr:site-specific integrase [Loktanella sp.]
MRWRVDGRTVQEQTEFRVGVKADRAKAEALLNERTEIFRLKREQDQLAILIRRRETIEQRLRKLQADAMPATRPLTLGKLEKEWRESPRRRDCSEAQLERYARQLAAFVDWAGEGLDVRAVGDDMAERYAKHLGIYAANTYNKHLNTLTAVWKAIGRTRGLGNPWQDLPRRRADTHVRRALTDAEIAKIIDAADGEYKALIIIGARTGLRLGDACQLKWSAFESDGVMRTVTRKTGAPVALPGEALKLEIETAIGKTSGQQQGFIMPGIAERYARDPSSVSDWVGRYFKRAGLKTSAKEKGWSKARPDASYHSLRHTFVTRAIEAGVAAPIVRALVGHNTAAMTDRYTHIGEAAILEAFKKAGL